ncbi:TPA: hypothetical protein U0467_000031 [Streptococcus suis]|nr:hypothetical protein [Streptococcus suis]HEM2624610.1 hypothetical protein [Streptococcus suis]
MAFDDNYSIYQQSIKNVLKNALGMLKTSGQGLFLCPQKRQFCKMSVGMAIFNKLTDIDDGLLLPTLLTVPKKAQQTLG